jgi:glutathione S-transferase
MIKLHYSPSSAAMAPHILLQEMGVPFEKVLVDTSAPARIAPRRIASSTRTGSIPTLVDGDLVLYESAAICLHLCDTHPGKPVLRLQLGTARASALLQMADLAHQHDAVNADRLFLHRALDG